MPFFRVVKAEFNKYFVQQFVTYRTAFWFLVLPFANGFLFYSMYLPFTNHLVPLNALGFNVKVDILGFTLIGQLLYGFFVGVVVSGSQFDNERSQGTFEAMLLTPASRVAILFGLLLAAAAQYLWLIIGAVVVFLIFFHFPVVVSDPLALMLSILLTYTALISLGLCLEAIFIHTRRGIMLGTVLQEPIAFGSGLVVPTGTFPFWVAQLTYLIPLTLGLITVRLTLLAGAALADVFIPLLGLLAMTLILPVLGKWLISHAEASAKAQGTLGFF